MEVQEAKNVPEFKRRFDNFVNEFISKSQNHCIVTREKATRILRILKEDPCVDDPQLKYYVKQKQFQLRDFPQLKLTNVLCVPTSRKNPSKANGGMFGKYHRVALKDEFFNIIHEIHTQAGSSKHLGYKSTVQEITHHHAHIPRALILNFIKMCPLCSQCPDDLNLLAAGDLSQSSIESDIQFPKDTFVDIKPDVRLLSEAISQGHFANGQHQAHPSTDSSPGPPFVSSLQYSPAPPPPATQWGNSLHQEPMDRIDHEIIEANHFMAVGKVSIINIQELFNLSSPPRQYACLVHYIDVWSKYSVLWPLRVRSMDELAFGIAKNVFAYFGSPKQIIYDTNFDEALELQESLKKWSKQVKVTVGPSEPLASSGPVHWKIMDKLQELLVESWEVKLSKLQYISNTKLVTTHEHISPFKAVIGNDPMTESFSELADKYNVRLDSLRPDFVSTHMQNNIPTESNSNPVIEPTGYSMDPDSTPIITNVCHIEQADSPLIPSPTASEQHIVSTATVCTVDVVNNSISELTEQLGTGMVDRGLSGNSESVSSPANQYPSPGAQISTIDDHSQDMITLTDDEDDNDDADNMIYIDDDDDTKNIELIENFHSTVVPPIPEPPTTEHRVENNGANNIALLEDFSSAVQPFNSENFPTQLGIDENDSKHIMFVGDYNPTGQPATSENSAADATEESVSELDKLPRLAQSFSFPSLFDNQEEEAETTSPNPTNLETSLATSLSDCGQPFLTQSAQNVIDKYKLRAKIQNTAQMKATRREDRPNHSKRKVHQEPLQCSLEISRQPKQRMLYAITSARGSQKKGSDHRYESRPDLEEKRKEYWRQMKQRARAKLSEEEKEVINKRRRQKYAERKMTYYYDEADRF